jgi:hypothetical protein
VELPSKQEVARGQPGAAGGAAQRRRQRKNREAGRRWKKGDFFAISENFRDLTVNQQ